MALVSLPGAAQDRLRAHMPYAVDSPYRLTRWASSSRSQRARRTAGAAACLAWEALSASVRCRLSTAVGGDCYSLGYSVDRESVPRAVADPKIGELLARGSARRAGLRVGCSGGGLEDNGVAEGFELSYMAGHIRVAPGVPGDRRRALRHLPLPTAVRLFQVRIMPERGWLPQRR